MQTLHGISGIQPSSAEIVALGRALELADFGGSIPIDPAIADEVEVAISRGDEVMPVCVLDYFLKQKHPALRAYVAARGRIAQCHRPPKLDTKHPRKCVDAARAYYHARNRSFAVRARYREQGGVRRLVDAFYGMTMARDDMLSLEYQEKRARNEQRANKQKEHADHLHNMGLAC